MLFASYSLCKVTHYAGSKTLSSEALETVFARRPVDSTRQNMAHAYHKRSYIIGRVKSEASWCQRRSTDYVIITETLLLVFTS